MRRHCPKCDSIKVEELVGRAYEILRCLECLACGYRWTENVPVREQAIHPNTRSSRRFRDIEKLGRDEGL